MSSGPGFGTSPAGLAPSRRLQQTLEQAEILAWVRTVIISGQTDYRRYQAAAMRQRFAVRFNGASRRRTSANRDPDQGRIINAPKRLNHEMAGLLGFKTATFTAFGLQRNGVWGDATAAQKMERFGLWFGAYVAPAKSEVQGLGAEPLKREALPPRIPGYSRAAGSASAAWLDLQTSTGPDPAPDEGGREASPADCGCGRVAAGGGHESARNLLRPVQVAGRAACLGVPGPVLVS